MNFDNALIKIEFRYRKPWSWNNPVSDNFAADWVMAFRKYIATLKALRKAQAKPSPTNSTEVMYWKSRKQFFRTQMKWFAQRRTYYLFSEKKFTVRVKRAKGKT